MLSTTSSSAAHFLRQGSYLPPCALSQVTLAGSVCVWMQFPLWKKWDGDTVREEIFHKGRRVCLVHVAAQIQFLAHSRCSKNACWIKEGMNEEALSLELKLRSGRWRLGCYVQSCRQPGFGLLILNLWRITVCQGAGGPAATPATGQILAVTATPQSSFLEVPFFGTTAQ